MYRLSYRGVVQGVPTISITIPLEFAEKFDREVEVLTSHNRVSSQIYEVPVHRLAHYLGKSRFSGRLLSRRATCFGFHPQVLRIERDEESLRLLVPISLSGSRRGLGRGVDTIVGNLGLFFLIAGRVLAEDSGIDSPAINIPVWSYQDGNGGHIEARLSHELFEFLQIFVGGSYLRNMAAVTRVYNEVGEALSVRRDYKRFQGANCHVQRGGRLVFGSSPWGGMCGNSDGGRLWEVSSHHIESGPAGMLMLLAGLATLEDEFKKWQKKG